jgi:hypothetical protein
MSVTEEQIDPPEDDFQQCYDCGKQFAIASGEVCLHEDPEDGKRTCIGALCGPCGEFHLEMHERADKRHEAERYEEDRADYFLSAWKDRDSE